MLTIFDTNIYINSLKGTLDLLLLSNLRQNHIIRLCPVVYHELLRGAKNKEPIKEIKKRTVMLGAPSAFLWEKAAQLLQNIKNHELPIQEIQNDLLIALTAVHSGAGLVTQDKHFEKISKLIPLKLILVP